MNACKCRNKKQIGRACVLQGKAKSKHAIVYMRLLHVDGLEEEQEKTKLFFLGKHTANMMVSRHLKLRHITADRCSNANFAAKQAAGAVLVMASKARRWPPFTPCQ